jgi:ferrous iron transport protein B
VTVERREGDAKLGRGRVRVIDLPGVYSLAPLSPDEAVVARVLGGKIAEVPPPDGLVVTVDACTLERSLLLVAEVLRLGTPVCIALTMVDELRARGGRIDLARLEAALGVRWSAWWATAALGSASCASCCPIPSAGADRRCPRPRSPASATPGWPRCSRGCW